MSEDLFRIRKVKRLPWTFLIEDLNGKEFFGAFYAKEFQKINQEALRIEKVKKRKVDKVYVKWKHYDNSFNSWIDEKDMVI